MYTSAHRGWSGASLSDDDLMKEGVGRDNEVAHFMDQSVSQRGIGVHNQFGVLPFTNVLNGLPGLGGYNAR